MHASTSCSPPPSPKQTFLHALRSRCYEPRTEPQPLSRPRLHNRAEMHNFIRYLLTSPSSQSRGQLCPICKRVDAAGSNCSAPLTPQRHPQPLHIHSPLLSITYSVRLQPHRGVFHPSFPLKKWSAFDTLCIHTPLHTSNLQIVSTPPPPFLASHRLKSQIIQSSCL